MLDTADAGQSRCAISGEPACAADHSRSSFSGRATAPACPSRWRSTGSVVTRSRCSTPEVQLGERESAADISRILDRYADGIVARLVSHRDLVTIAGAASSPVINALTDAEHPCQVLADCMTVRSVTGRLAGATVAYIGDGNNVCTSWIYAAALLGVRPASDLPQGTSPPRRSSNGRRRLRVRARRIRDHPRGGAGARRYRNHLHRRLDKHVGRITTAARRARMFAATCEVNDEPGWAGAAATVRVMHCLPAHRGEEITDLRGSSTGPQSVVFDQAENRLLGAAWRCCP